jgi:hypothetical protein
MLSHLRRHVNGSGSKRPSRHMSNFYDCFQNGPKKCSVTRDLVNLCFRKAKVVETSLEEQKKEEEPMPLLHCLCDKPAAKATSAQHPGQVIGLHFYLYLFVKTIFRFISSAPMMHAVFCSTINPQYHLLQLFIRKILISRVCPSYNEPETKFPFLYTTDCFFFCFLLVAL